MEDLDSVADLELVDCSHHSVDGGCRVRDNLPDRLDCHLDHLEEHHHRAELVGIEAVAARIRTAGAAAVGLMEEDQEAAAEAGRGIAGCQPSDERRPGWVQVG